MTSSERVEDPFIPASAVCWIPCIQFADKTPETRLISR
jgi:hypothetical protein